MSIVSQEISYERDPEVKEFLLNANRPYNRELKRLKQLINFGVISNEWAVRVSDEFKDREHRTALIMNRKLK